MITQFNSLLVSVTEACHVGCRHCGFRGSKRDRESDPDEMTEWVRQACRYGIPMMIFTGGEPFERFDVLAAGVAAAAAEGARVGIFTSSYWGSSYTNARDLLSRLRGTSRLYLSTDIYHQQRVPVAYVRNVIDAGLDLGIPDVSLMITFATLEDRDSIAANYADYSDRVSIFSDRVIPNPRVRRRDGLENDQLVSLTPHVFKSTCWLATPLVNPNGDVFACHIGKAAAHRDLRELPYYLGSLREARFDEVIAAARRRPDYQFLRTHGPKGVAEAIVSRPEVVEGLERTAFANACDMCMSVLKTAPGRAALSEHAAGSKEAIDLRLQLLLGEESVFDTDAPPVAMS